MDVLMNRLLQIIMLISEDSLVVFIFLLFISLIVLLHYVISNVKDGSDED